MLNSQTRVGRILAAVGLMAGLTMFSSGAVSAGAGANNFGAKQCKDWATLYRLDGSTFVDKGACTSYTAQGGTILTSPPPPPSDPTPNVVMVTMPASVSGSYKATGANFGPAPTAGGVFGALVRVNDGVGDTADGCSPLSLDFPAGSIAVVNRGSCAFVDQVLNAQNSGAVAVVVVNNVEGSPITLTGTAPAVGIPSVMVSRLDGLTILFEGYASGVLKAA
jgi:PA domain